MKNILSTPEFLESHPICSLNDVFSHPLADGDRQDDLWSIINTSEHKSPFSPSFLNLLFFVRNLNKSAFHAMEGAPACQQELWRASDDPARSLKGGGAMTVIRANVLEKSAVNMSVVYGPHYPATEGEYAGKPFAAAGVSLISHPKNPYAPIMHLNVRCIEIYDGQGRVVKSWMGGGADLTPMIPFAEDTALFHEAMKTA
jgi:coproporphyrinogen III oxidase